MMTYITATLRNLNQHERDVKRTAALIRCSQLQAQAELSGQAALARLLRGLGSKLRREVSA